MEAIQAKAKLGRNGDLQKVLATVQVTVPVDVQLFEDGSFELLKVQGADERTISISADRVESLIGEEYDDDMLEDVYRDAAGLDLDPDNDGEGDDDSADDGLF